MDIEKLNDNKIKVTLSFEDLFERDLDHDILQYDSPEAQDLFWDMMEQAELLYGFDTADSQLCVEAIPDSSNGFIVTITKISDDEEFQDYPKFIKATYTKGDFKPKQKQPSKYNAGKISISFQAIEELKMFSKRILNMYIGKSDLFRYREKYFLILTRNTFVNVDNPKILDAIISEYGLKISKSNIVEGFLNEHGRKIIHENALPMILDYY